MLSIHVDNLRQHSVSNHEAGEVSLGRQPSASGAFVVIDDDYVSRRQMRVIDVSPGDITFENVGSNPLHTTDGKRYKLGDIATLPLPCTLHIGHTKIHFEWRKAAQHDIMQDTVPGMPHLRLGTTLLEPPAESHLPLSSLGQTPSAEKLTYWFETLLTVQRAAVGSPKFYRETAEAIVKLVGLDRGLVVLREADKWIVVAAAAADENTHIEYSKSILEKVVTSKHTVYGNPMDMSARDSLASLEAVVGAPIFARDQEVVGMLYGSRDLTQGLPHYSITTLEAHVVQLLACSISAGHNREQMEHRLNQSEQLAAVGQALGFILHDLRGPLGNTKQLVEMLRSDDTSLLSREEQLQFIEDSIGAASELLNDSLEFCRGQTRVDPVRGTFKEMFARQLKLLRLSLEGFDAQLQIQVPDRLELVADPDRLARVLRNLVKNAAEALQGRPNAIVTIGGARVGNESQLWVADNGPGLPAEVKERMFQPFATQGKQGGTGFGLAIAQQIVVAHGGTIEVESGTQGTRFVMMLPDNPSAKPFERIGSTALKTADEALTQPPAMSNASPSQSRSREEKRTFRILLAEDMLINQRLVKSLLENLGHRVVIAEDGQRALELWRAEPFDVILMDIEMPRLDGLSACRKIRKEEPAGRHVPIIGLTGHETPQAHQRCQEAGMDSYLPKPIRVEVLEEVLSDVMSQRI